MLGNRKKFVINGLVVSPLCYTLAAGVSFLFVMLAVKLTGVGNRHGFLNLLTIVYVSGLVGSIVVGFASVCLNIFGANVQMENKPLILTNFGLVFLLSLSPFVLSIALGVNALLIVPVVSLTYAAIFSAVIYASEMLVSDGNETAH